MRGIAIGVCVLWCLGGHPTAARAAEDPTTTTPPTQQAQQAKVAYEKAMAEFGLGDYAQAAADYETAFRLKPDGALLYNAAQAHRLAGNKKRALDLYRNFVRLYNNGKSAQVPDAKKRIAELERALAEEHAAPTPPGADKPLPAISSGGAAAGGAANSGAANSVTTTSGGAPTPPDPTGPVPAPAPTKTTVTAGTAPSPAPPPLPPVAEPAPTPETLVVASPPTGDDAQKQNEKPQRSLLASPWFWSGVGAVIVAGVVVLLVASRPSYPDANLGSQTLAP